MRIAVRTHLASQALPAAGVYTDQAAFDVPEGTKELIIYASYSRAGVGGRPAFLPMYGNGDSEARGVVIDSSSFAPSPPEGAYDIYMEKIGGPVPTGAGVPIEYTLRFPMDGGNTTFRLLVAELGATGTPGTIELTLTGS